MTHLTEEEQIELLLEERKHLDAKLEMAIEALERIPGMAGNPDAIEGCRVIMNYAIEALKKIKS